MVFGDSRIQRTRTLSRKGVARCFGNQVEIRHRAGITAHDKSRLSGDWVPIIGFMTQEITRVELSNPQ